MFGLDTETMIQAGTGLGVLLGAALIVYLFWRTRVYVINKLRDDVYIDNNQGHIQLIAPPLSNLYKYILGPSEFEKVKRRQESKVLYLEPIIEDAKAMLSTGKLSSPSEKPVYFTAFYPKRTAIGSWHNIIVYMHIESAVRDILKDVQRVSTGLEELEAVDEPEVRMKNRRTAWLTQGSRITLLPKIPGIKFNPPHQHIWWVEDFNRATLYFMGGTNVLNKRVEGEIAVHIGFIEIASIPITLQFEEAAPLTDENIDVKLLSSSTQMYRNIFASYSVEDKEITETLLKALVATGDAVLFDCLMKKGNPDWPQLQKQAIRRAKKMQLLWSANAAKSSLVKQEIQTALTQNGREEPLQISPIYWTEPKPTTPKELSHLEFKYISQKINK